jgi:hypothetical protein
VWKRTSCSQITKSSLSRLLGLLFPRRTHLVTNPVSPQLKFVTVKSGCLKGTSPFQQYGERPRKRFPNRKSNQCYGAKLKELNKHDMISRSEPTVQPRSDSGLRVVARTLGLRRNFEVHFQIGFEPNFGQSCCCHKGWSRTSGAAFLVWGMGAVVCGAWVLVLE